MIDRARLLTQLEYASFTQRGALAAETAAAASADELDALVAALDDERAGVRLGVLAVLGAARHRPALSRLVAHARARTGDDRVFALAALAALAQPGDEPLRAPALAWSRDADGFVAAQAQKLLLALGAGPGTPRAALEQLVTSLFTATRAADRLRDVAAIEARGPAALAAVARLALTKGPSDAVALVAQALVRHADAIPDGAALVLLIPAARRRLAAAPATVAALDDAALALGGLAAVPMLLARLGELAPTQVDAVVVRLLREPAPAIALHAPPMLAALATRPAMWSSLGPALVVAAPHLRDGLRTELRARVDRELGALRTGVALPPVTVVAVAHVLAELAAVGEPLPTPLVRALERLPVGEAAIALCALCARLATEPAAVALLGLTRDPLPVAQAAAREAMAAWRSPWIAFVDGAVVARYVDAAGAALVRVDGGLRDGAGAAWILDGAGVPIPAATAEHGACTCCAPPRALAHPRREGLRCLATWIGYLRDGDAIVRADQHPHGRCTACESVRPRVREGDRTVCLACGAGRAPVVSRPAEPGRPGLDERVGDGLPRPPTIDEFAHVAPTIRTAMGANVFLRARDGGDGWNGSGIVIARDGNHVLILTNRHVVESDDQLRLCRLEAMTVAGEARELRVVWRAGRGVDLALVEGTVGDADQLGVMALGGGAALVGASVFAIGNPLGLAWSYSAGTLSAVRQWSTSAGQPLQIFQTDTTISPGSSGGGLWHVDGHLLGVMSFLQQAHVGASAHFALSIAAVRDAFAREDVRWRGRVLTSLP